MRLYILIFCLNVWTGSRQDELVMRLVEARVQVCGLHPGGGGVLVVRRRRRDT